MKGFISSQVVRKVKEQEGRECMQSMRDRRGGSVGGKDQRRLEGSVRPEKGGAAMSDLEPFKRRRGWE
jgi:hypothetical protein